MRKLFVVLFALAFFAHSTKAKPIQLPDFLENWFYKIKSFFKSPGIFQLRTISGFICNVTKTPDFRLDQMGPNLVVDIPVAILLKTINYVSCRSAESGEHVDAEVIEVTLNQHRGEALKMRLLPVNLTSGDFPVFQAEAFVATSSATHTTMATTLLTFALLLLLIQ